MVSTLKNGDYILGKKLGKGSFGQVYECKNMEGRIFAAKLEPRKKNGKRRRGPSQLEYEFRVYNLLKVNSINPPGIPNVYDFFVEGDYNVLIMDMLGDSVQTVFHNQGRKIQFNRVMAIASRVLHQLEYIHSKGLIHRDLKPQNLMLSLYATKPEIYLIDFGLSKRFLHDGYHIEYRDNKKGITGTPRYCSINTHLGIEQSRLDDLESLVYVCIYLINGKLPWQNLGGKKKMRSAEEKRLRHQSILEKKQSISTRELCHNMPNSFKEFVTSIRSLKFEEKPNYKYLYSLLQHAHDDFLRK